MLGEISVAGIDSKVAKHARTGEQGNNFQLATSYLQITSSTTPMEKWLLWSPGCPVVWWLPSFSPGRFMSDLKPCAWPVSQLIWALPKLAIWGPEPNYFSWLTLLVASSGKWTTVVFFISRFSQSTPVFFPVQGSLPASFQGRPPRSRSTSKWHRWPSGGSLRWPPQRPPSWRSARPFPLRPWEVDVYGFFGLFLRCVWLL